MSAHDRPESGIADDAALTAGAGLRDRFGLALLLLLVSFLVDALANQTLGALLSILFNVAAVVVTLAAAGSLGNALSRLAVAGLAVVALVFAGLGPNDASAPAPQALGALAALALNVLMVSVVLRRVGSHRQVTVQTLLGAVCAYALIGLGFSSIYRLLDSLGAAPLFGRHVARSVYSYFSFLTLTTTGYGDYTAQTALAQRIAMVEAVLGQMFVATTIAGLVALHIRHERAQN